MELRAFVGDWQLRTAVGTGVEITQQSRWFAPRICPQKSLGTAAEQAA